MRRQRFGQARWTRCVMCAVGVLASSCLVTNDVDFRVVNSPPALERISPGGVTWVPLVSDPDCRQEIEDHVYMQLDVRLVDADIDQTLWARVLINGEPDPANVNRQIGPAPGADPVRVIDPPICVDATAWLTQPCNRVELLVTSGFAPNPLVFDSTLLDHDLARLDWLVLPGAMNAPELGPAACAALLQDAGAP